MASNDDIDSKLIDMVSTVTNTIVGLNGDINALKTSAINNLSTNDVVDESYTIKMYALLRAIEVQYAHLNASLGDETDATKESTLKLLAALSHTVTYTEKLRNLMLTKATEVEIPATTVNMDDLNDLTDMVKAEFSNTN
tara:strand:+ start:15925 stop:16341 length:417 start_codon:yes stop_codon:yes gene_type:complete